MGESKKIKTQKIRERDIYKKYCSSKNLYKKVDCKAFIYINIYCSTLAISRGLTRIVEMAVALAAEKALSPNPKFISKLVSLEEEEDMDETFPSKSTLLVAAINHKGRLRQPHARVERGKICSTTFFQKNIR